MKTNYHTHSYFCDGAEEPEAYVLKAIEKGFTHLGFSGHAPVSFENHFAIKQERLSEYCQTIRDLAKKYVSQIKVFLGLEADYIPGISKNFQELKDENKLDYIIGGIHLVKSLDSNDLWFIDGSNIETYDKGLQELFGNDVKKAVTAFFTQTNQMIVGEKPDVIAHFDKIKMNNKGRYFSEEEKWYRDLLLETLDLIQENNCICEINVRGLYKKRHADYFPAQNLWQELLRRKIPIMVSSDAHSPTELDELFDQTHTQLKQAGFTETWYFEDAWKSEKL